MSGLDADTKRLPTEEFLDLTGGLTRGLDHLVVVLCVVWLSYVWSVVFVFSLCGFHLHTLLRTLGERIHPYIGTGGRGLIQVY